MPKCPTAPERIYQLTITLNVSKPPVWHRTEVADHSEHEELLEWFGAGFDPEQFDSATVYSVLLRTR